jgi:uncharacterized protein
MNPVIPIPMEQCTQCQTPSIPPQYVCRKCGHTGFSKIEYSGRGTVYTCTTIRVAPEAFRDQAPYTIAVVDLPPGLRVTGRIAGEAADTVKIGQEVAFERVDQYGYWFSPVV